MSEYNTFGHAVYKNLFKYYKEICIPKEQDCVVFILGSEGSGKSSLALSILKYFWDNLYKDMGLASSFHELIEECIVHSETDLERWYGVYGDKKYFPLWIDEGTIIDKRQGMKDTVVRFTKYLQRCRERQKLIIICNPIDVDKRVCRYRYTYFVSIIKTKDYDTQTKKLKIKRYGLLIGRKAGALSENAIDMLIRLYTSNLFHSMVASLFPIIDEAYKQIEAKFDQILEESKNKMDQTQYLYYMITKEITGVKKVKGMIDLLLGESFSGYYVSGLLQIYRNLIYHGNFEAEDLIFSEEDNEAYLKVKQDKFSLWVQTECSSYVYYKEYVPIVMNHILKSLIFETTGGDKPSIEKIIQKYKVIDIYYDMLLYLYEDDDPIVQLYKEFTADIVGFTKKLAEKYLEESLVEIPKFITFRGNEKEFANRLLEDYKNIGGRTKIKADDIYKTLYILSKIDMENFVLYLNRKENKIEIVVKSNQEKKPSLKHVYYEDYIGSTSVTIPSILQLIDDMFMDYCLANLSARWRYDLIKQPSFIDQFIKEVEKREDLDAFEHKAQHDENYAKWNFIYKLFTE